MRRRLLAFATAAVAAIGCGLPEPEPFTRVLSASPEGDGASTEAVPAVDFSGPVDPGGLLDGRLLVLVPAEALAAARTAVESEAGAAALAGAVAVEARVEDGGRRIVLAPRAPLRGFTPYSLVLSSRARAADGRAVLDPEGRRRTFVSSFETGAPSGPPPRPAITEVRADAATPEAGGEYVEIANLGEGALDLGGWRLAKRTASGTLSSCEIGAPPGAVVAPGAVALVAGGAWDGRYLLPAGVPVFACGAAALLGGIANDRPPELLLADPAGAPASTLGTKGAPACRERAIERLDPAGPDAPENLGCSVGEGTPGWLP